LDREKTNLISEVLGNSYRTNAERLFTCPFCKHHKKKLSINLKKSVYKCWVCDATGSIGKLIFKFGNRDHKQEWKRLSGKVDIGEFDNLFASEEQVCETETQIELPAEFITLTSPTSSREAAKAMNYLKERGLNEDDILKWKIGFCPSGTYKERVIIPSFNSEGYCNYFIARAYGKEWPKYKNPPASRNIIFNELFLNRDEDVTLVEGAFDAIVAGNAIPLLGSTLRESSKLFQLLAEYEKTIYLALDKDVDKKTLSLVRMLQKHNKTVYKIDTSDIEDIAAITKEEFFKRKSTALLMDSDNYLFYEVLNV
jgi:DNA primase